MKPKRRRHEAKSKRSGLRLEPMLDHRHPLYKLSGVVEWSRFETAFEALYAESGRAGCSTRLMVG